MQCITAGFHRHIHNMVGVQVSRQGVLADLISFVGFFDVQGVLVSLRMNSDRADAQFAAGPGNPDRNLSAIGDQQLPNSHGKSSR